MFLGLVEMTFGLVYSRFSLPEWQALKMYFSPLEKMGWEIFVSVFWKPHSQVLPLFVYRGLQVKVVVCFLILGAGRAVNVLVPYMYKVLGEFHYYFVLMILFWAKFGASPREVYKFVTHAALALHIDRTVRQKLKMRIFL